MEEYSFEVETTFGEKVTLTSIAIIEDQENNINYLIYTDNTFDEENLPNLFVSKLVRENDNFSLEEVANYNEIDLITKEIDRILKKYSSEN